MDTPLSIQKFSENVRVFINWAEKAEEDYTPSILLRHLTSLYLSALNLPKSYPSKFPVKEFDDSKINIPHAKLGEIYARASKLPFQYYGVVFNSLEIPPEEAVIGDIADDIRDIYADIHEGLFLFDQGYTSQAYWEWRLLFKSHWGKHATGAIQALHDFLSEEDWEGLLSDESPLG